jgi:hypothetical protein
VLPISIPSGLRVPLKPIAEYQPERYLPKTLVIVAMVAVAILYAASMLLNWVGVVTPTGGYVIVNGLHQANWMLLVAAVVAAIAARLSVAPPAGFIRFVFVALDFFVPLGLYIEYIDNLGRAESDTIKPYLGPGFFLALGTTVLLIATTVFGWRERDIWQDLTGTASQG